jgi:di/tricarboxylate transporter
MITVLGTSTNLVLNGLILDYDLPLLGFTDFFFLGVIVTLVGWVYFYFVGYNQLPEHIGKLDVVKGNLKEYIVETELFPGSKLIGQTIKDAGLRNLSDLFLVEIVRGEEIISPVAPEEKLESGDLLFFSGNTESIYNLIKEDNGLSVHKERLEAGNFTFLEAVVPANSNLIGVKIKNSDFRKKYDASIVAVHRDGKRISGKVGETELQGGDFLLLVTDQDHEKSLNTQNLFFLSVPKSISVAKPAWFRYLGLVSFSVLLLGIINVIPLFFAVLLVLCGFVFLGVLGRDEIREELDLGLLMILVCSLAVGVGLEKSGTASLIATLMISAGKSLGVVAAISILFIVTIVLTSLISNAAAVAIVFPVAMSMSSQLHLSATPFFVAIAFAASGCFLTPIGYQTNLMVYGPGGYNFKDFMKVGGPFTIIYSVICIVFITRFYSLA